MQEGQRDWDLRKEARVQNIMRLELRAERVHKELIEKWKKGEHDAVLLDEDLTIHRELDRARKELEVILRVKA